MIKFYKFMPEYTPSLAVFCVAILSMMLLAVFKPSFHIKNKFIDYNMDSFWIPTFLAALIMLAAREIPFKVAMKGLWKYSTLNPIGILILFFSMVYISKFLDTTGFFKICATWAIDKAGNNGKRLFFVVYFIVGILTIFTSNDVVILTFTPIIFYFTQSTGIDPKPLLFSEFFAANTFSMIFIISNPTNVVLGNGFGINFVEFVKYMILPTIAGVSANVILLYFMFKKEINQEFDISDDEKKSPSDYITSKLDLIIGMVFMLGSVILMACSSIPGFSIEMWQIAGIMAVFLLVYNIVIDIIRYKEVEKTKLRIIFSTLPYPIIPFLLSLFILINTLTIQGLFEDIGKGIGKVTNKNGNIGVIIFGFLSTLAANILNNIPMSLSFVPILKSTQNKPFLGNIFATVAGANLGANLTPIGALAGIMWLGILKNLNINIGFKEFIKVGIIITPISVLATVLLLMLSSNYF